MNVVDKIYDAFYSTDKTLVFTSETVARSAITLFIEKYQGKAVFKDRALSWDRFLLSILDIGEKKSVNKTMRKLFSYSFLKNGGFNKLRHFVSKDYPESILSYASYIASLLPYLPGKDDPMRSEIDYDMLCDIDLIRDSYIPYLEEKGLYEKNYLEPSFSRIEKGRYIFVFPQTFTSNIPKKIIDMGLVEIIEESGDEETPLIEYDNSLSEIRWTLREIEKDREKYRDDDIAITSSSLSLYRPYLESEAAKRDIPLIFTSSTPLKNHPEGRFLHALYSSFTDSFSFKEMKRLLLNPEYPFKDKEKYVEILREGVENKMDGDWRYVLSSENMEIMHDLTSSIERIVKSRRAPLTLSYIKEFRDKYFIEGEWNEVDDPVFGSALDLLYKMGEERIDDLYMLFLSLLDETDYVPRNDTKSGIRVYAYPASSGLITKVHYVIGLDDKTTETKIDDYPFLTLSKRDDVREISSSILSTYRNKSFSKKLVLSGTSLSFDGARLIPPLFLDSSIKADKTIDDAYSAERALWLEGKRSSIKPYERQRESYNKALKTSLRGRKTNVLLESFIDEELSLSVSKIKDYDKCPFRGFVSSRLKLDEKNYDVVLDDSRVKGEILHSTIEKALEKYKKLEEIDPIDLENIFLDEIKNNERKGKITAPFVSAGIKGKYIDKLQKTFSSNRSQIYRSLTLLKNEVKIKDYKLVGNITINGRVDTILTDDDGGLYIIDWKTSGNNDYSNTSLDDTSLQVILYALIVDKDKVKGGAFFSFSNGDYGIVWPRETYTAGNGRNYEEGFEKDEVTANAERRLEKIKKTLIEGDFTPQYSEKNCSYCRSFRLCRAKFVSSLEEDND